jgi:ribosomal protein S12 methylthiotransferase accessory factor
LGHGAAGAVLTLLSNEERMPSLKRLLDVLDSLVDDRVGVVNHLSEAPADAGAPQLFHYYAQASNTSAFCSQENFVYTGGASYNRELAMAKAVGEAVERYCSAIYDVEELPLCSRQEADFRCVPPSDWALYTEDQYQRPGFPFVPFDDSTPVRWAEAIDPITGELWHVPAAMVYMPYYYYMKTADSPIVQPISSGMACHCSPAEAAMSGISEVVERDAFMITWLARLAPPRIAVDSLSDRNYDLVQRFERTGSSVTLFNVTTDVGIPTIMSVLQSPSPQAPALVFANSSSLSAEEAVRNSLEELAHTRRFMQQIVNHMPRLVPAPPDHDNVVDQMTHLNFWCDHTNAGLADFLWKSKQRIDFDDLPNDATGRPADDLHTMCEKIRGAGHQVLLVDLTSPDIEPLGLTALRALIPGFHPLTMGYSIRALGGKRLAEVPAKLKQPGISPDRGDNPSPHPFP